MLNNDNKNYEKFISALSLERYKLRKDIILKFIQESDIPIRIKLIGIDYYFKNDSPALKYVGEMYHVSPERIRQIIAKFINMLKHPKRYSYLVAAVDEVFAEFVFARDILQKRLNDINMEIQKYDLEIPTEYNVDISDCYFSIRTENALRCAGLNTLYDLSNKTEYDLLRITNIGKKALTEIKYGLECNGIKLLCIGVV